MRGPLPVRIKFVKLVRDKVPQFYPRLDVAWQPTDPAERATLLKGKLVEEVVEYLVSGEVEELADVVEVVASLANLADKTIYDVLTMAAEKHESRGGYAEGIGMYVAGADHGDPRTDYDTLEGETT